MYKEIKRRRGKVESQEKKNNEKVQESKGSRVAKDAAGVIIVSSFFPELLVSC